MPFQVCRHQFVSQRRQIGHVGLRKNQLMWVGSSVRAHSHGLAAPDEFGPALSKTPPAPSDQVGRSSVRGAVPTFHRQDGPAVADGFWYANTGRDHASQHPGLGCVIDGQGVSKSCEPLAQLLGALEDR